jgi:predicted ATPase
MMELIFDRLADDGTTADVADLVLEALGPAASPPQGSESHLYLSSVTVAGFRGVGARRTLPIRPGPGLTLVVGRNGSGKSSFAEAIELLLTGDSARWADRSSVWRTGWRNLHQPEPCVIEAELRADGHPAPLRLRRAWPADAALADGKPTGADLAELRRPMELYRPFLTAAEIGRLVTGTPSALFDAIDAILGLDALTAADQRLQAAVKPLDAAVKEGRDERVRLREALAGLDDDRAQRAVDALDEPGALAPLLVADDPVDDVAALAEELRGVAVPAHEAATERVAELLRLALAHHTAAGDGTCPVCGTGTLDASWRVSAAAALEGRQATTRRETLARRALAIVETPLPEPSERDAALPVGPFAAAVEALRAAPTDAGGLAAHLLARYPGLVQAAEAVRAAAAEELRQRDAVWQRLVPDLRRWAETARALPDQRRRLATLKAARAWLRAAGVDLRNQRLAPFAAHAQRIWEQLRQESNVQLGTMALTGTATRRRIEFPVSVDGVDNGAALGVMSQGEMQALGLALFLPRACAAQSPFRFVVIDDPVQSMDPSKVDGLARVLADLAVDRQVVVFTHDPRLPDAVRRLEIDAVTLQVVRAERSVVSVEPVADPVTRYLDDARALARSDEVDPDVRTPVIAELCRSALEAAGQRVVWRVRTARGDSVAHIEEALEDAGKSVMKLLALALFDDADRGGEVLRTLNNRHGRWAVDVFNACRRAVHGGQVVPDLVAFVRDAGRLAEALR